MLKVAIFVWYQKLFATNLTAFFNHFQFLFITIGDKISNFNRFGEK